MGIRLVEFDGLPLQHQVCKSANEDSAIKGVVLLGRGGLVDAKTPAAGGREWKGGAPPSLVFVLQIMENVIHVRLAIASTGVIILDC